jgi:predicted transcriptional regulator
MFDILEICLEGANKSKVVYGANLNFSRLNKYLNVLSGLGFLSLDVAYDGLGPRVLYKTTKAGKDFRDRFLNMCNDPCKTRSEKEALKEALATLPLI